MFLRGPRATKLQPLRFIRGFKIGDRIPKGVAGIQENSPGNTIDIGEEVSNGKNIIIGLPAAFSPACSSSHVPGFIKHLKEFENKGFSKILVTTVNDSFVTKAWSESLNCPKEIRIIADTQGNFAKKGGYLFDAKNVLGNERSMRYVLIVEDGIVVKEFLEPDKIGLKVSSAENVINSL
ncbi:hypothetical protein Kpol_1020p26 [Vanderwaltozyma polyspora DSM 70294]|uniref:Redoxin domain-containing protein n=1 Tax=Vanderwaltozyma polyspora (strain ATCC 22028 / DSM 70294 / BCRC 21397 / CBS 2163 / NBRC 10782 / NRRL Y-8283 / UCD 57-17) TaxID=436907 RepID=A7TLD7_VANPO|nr:uncharacterized protein Kpol_1020p26 [Vanderwaltozyma polyspora DSM 70294]EDO16918.1 hypothetical protein Kpol_1020p26 [Vanderwaltozyma polyspora DSM 70294]